MLSLMLLWMSEEATSSDTTELFYKNVRHYREGEDNVYVKFCVFSCMEMT